MPELPEVEVVRRGLETHAAGRTIDAVTVLHPRPVRAHPVGPDAFAAELTGRAIDAVRRKGKYLWLVLGDDAVIDVRYPADRSTLLGASTAPAIRAPRACSPT